MKKGRASKTAEYVCMGRAIAHQLLSNEGFVDPTALLLLPDEAQREVRRIQAGAPPVGIKARMWHQYLLTQAMMMAARTAWIDERIRAAGCPQLVILGAGLDGRAWRMPELRDVSVFEVDHPDSQRDKRARVANLSPMSCDIRFVPVDFEHDALAAALAAAGHDETRPTTWVWEGVIMYLTQADIEATLSVLQRRSASGSRLILAYHVPALRLKVIGYLLRRIGEPLRSSFRPGQLRSLLRSYGFEVSVDEDLAEAGRALSPKVGRIAERVRHLHVAIATRAAATN